MVLLFSWQPNYQSAKNNDIYNLHYNICKKNPTYCLAIYYHQTIMMKIDIVMTLTLHMHACTTLYGLAGINQTCTLLQNNVL